MSNESQKESIEDSDSIIDDNYKESNECEEGSDAIKEVDKTNLGDRKKNGI